MASNKKHNPVKSLQVLAASKAVEELLKCDNPTTEFFTLDEHLQKLVFAQFLSRYDRLEKRNTHHRIHEWLTPFIDWKLYSQEYDLIEFPEQLDPQSDVEEHDLNEVPEQLDPQSDEYKTNGHVLKAKFRELWHHATDRELSEPAEGVTNSDLRPNRFHSLDVCSHGAEGEFTVCNVFDACENIPPCGFSPREHRYLYDKISTQLLYYRVATTFGMPPAHPTDAYKVCWKAILQHKDGTSRLYLNDWKGNAHSSFSGTKEAREDALELLNFLTGLNCPHPFGHIAGS
jgi:hypothetical protein